MGENQEETQKFIPGPPQLPPLYKGQKIKTVSGIKQLDTITNNSIVK